MCKTSDQSVHRVTSDHYGPSGKWAKCSLPSGRCLSGYWRSVHKPSGEIETKWSKEMLVHIWVVLFLTPGIFLHLLHNFTYLHILHSLLFNYCTTRSKRFLFWIIINRSGLARYNDISLIHFMFMYIYIITPAVLWPKYCRYGVKHYIINQSINHYTII